MPDPLPLIVDAPGAAQAPEAAPAPAPEARPEAHAPEAAGGEGGAVASWVDPATGLRVSGVGGKAVFHVGERFVTGSPADVFALHPDAVPAAPEAIQHRLEVKAQDTTAGQIKAGVKSLAAHAFDASTALIRVPAQLAASAVGDEEGLKDLQNLTGQGMMDNVAQIIGDLTNSNKTGEASAREYREATKAQFEANPHTRFAAGIAGDIGPGILMGGLAEGPGLADTLGEKATELAEHKLGYVAAKALGGSVEAGAQGIGFGANGAAEEAYIENTPLTRQKLWTGAFIGGALGAGIGGTIGALGALRGGPKLSELVEGPATHEESALSKALGGAEPDAAHAQEVAEKALAPEGVEPAPGVGKALNDLLSDVQSATTTTEKSALEKYGPGAILDKARRGEALDGWTLARNRPQIIEQATKDVSEGMTTLEEKAGGDVFQQVRDLGMKREAWSKLLDPEKAGMQIDAARGAIGDIRSKLEDMLDDTTTYGDQARLKSVFRHADKAEAELTKDGLTGEDAAMVLDGFKRDLGKLTRGSAKKLASLRQAGDFEADAVYNTAKQFSDHYEQVRQLLMDTDTWGKAAEAQQEINKGWENWIDSRRMYSGALMRSTGERESAEILGFKAGQRFEIDPDKVGSWIDKFGTGRGKLNDEYIRAHLDATEQLSNSIGKYVDTGKVGESVQAVKDAAQKIKSSLETANKTVAVSNQINSILTAQGSMGAQLMGGAMGAITAGPLGGALGTALGAIANPGRMLRTAMAIHGLVGSVDASKADLIDSFFEKAAAATTSTARKVGKAVEHTAHTYGEKAVEAGLETAEAEGNEGADAAEHVARKIGAAGAGFAAKFYEGAKDQATAYTKRREELAALTSNPALMVHRTQMVLGALPGIAPQLASSLAMDAARNLSLLQKMAPPATPTGGLFHGKTIRPAFTPQQDMEKFAQQWDGVMNPMSVLHDLNKGALSMDKVMAARMAHPEMFADIATDFLERMSKMRKPMNHQAALQADLLLGLNGAGEPSVEPGFLSRIAALNQVDQQDAKSPPSPRPPVNLAKGRATLSQSLEGA